MNRLHLSCRDGDGANKERMNELSRSSDTPVVQHSVVEHGGVTSLILMVTPQGRGSTAEQLVEALQAVDDTLRGQRTPQHPVTQTVFLRDLRDRALCEKIFAEHYRNAGPVSTYVQQPPCDGAALAIELCAVGGPPVRIGRPAPDVLVAGYHGIQITYCGGVSCPEAVGDVYEKALDGFRQMKQKLARAGVNFDRVIRTWLYLGDITGPERRCDGACFERYMELNRARTDFYENIRFGKGLLLDENREGIYPASTGIGMDGHGIVMSCVALETRRDDVFLQPLENPQQTPVYHYEPVYSPKSPKFSRAMAVVADGCATLWISGTASIVNSKT
ncbi:MAG: hypothetical protein N3B01_07200, partial [Verrucomicrobiae bacterium]|nr:hypothetical protein [Verrucomicrobiae bacterium]